MTKRKEKNPHDLALLATLHCLSEWDIHIVGLYFVSLIFNFMPLQNICCTCRSNSRSPLLPEKKAKTLSLNICVFTIHWIKDIDCSSSRFRESTSITIPNGFWTFYDSWTTKMLDRRVSFPPLPVQIQLVYEQTSFDFSCIWVYVRVSTQVCTRAVVTQIHKDKHQAGALIGVPQLWPMLQLN